MARKLDALRALRCPAASILAIVTLGHSVAQAQAQIPQAARDAAESPGETTQEHSQGDLDEVVVTARKTAERSLDVPIAVTAFSQEQLQRYSSNDLQLVARATPGLVIGPQTGASGTAINLRGVGGSPSSFTVEQPVSLNLDGVQLSQAASARLGLFDVDRIEVLKGPQALFFGKNSPAGVVSIVSANPGRELAAKARVGYEFANRERLIEAAISGPLTPTLSARMAVFASKQDGWFLNGIRPSAAAGLVPDNLRSINNEEISGRATIAFRAPDGNFNATLKMAGSHQDRRGGFHALSQYFYCPAGRPAQTAGLAGTSTDCKVDRFYIDARAPAAGASLHPIFRDGNSYAFSRSYLASLAMQYDVSDVLSLETSTGYYSNREQRFSGSSNFNDSSSLLFGVNNGYRQLSQEVRLRTSFDGPFDLLVGGYAETSTLNLYDQPLASGPPAVAAYVLTSNQRWKVKGHNLSAFAQATYEIVENLKLEAGARWSTETKSVGGQQQARVANFGPLPLTVSERTFRNLSPEATLTFKPASDINVYATYRTGFKSGGFNVGTNTAANTDVSFRPERVNGAEIGVKGLFLDQQLRLDTAAYRYAYKDLQVGFSNPAIQGTQIFNAASARVQGVEASAVLVPRPLSDLSLRASISYNDAHFSDYIGPCYTGQRPAEGCNLTLRGTAFTAQELANRPLNRAPKWTANAGATWAHDIGDRLGIDVSADATYSSSYVHEATYSPQGVQAGYWRFDASVALRGRDRWRLALIGRNLTNELVIVNSTIAAFTGSGTGTANGVRGDHTGTLGAPRTVQLELTIGL